MCLAGILRAPARPALATTDLRTASKASTAEVPASNGPTAGPARRAADELAAQLAQALAPGLYLVATPIGNLGDITLRAIATLARADVLYCEDTRHSGMLLAHYGISGRLRPYHEHNAQRERPRVLAELAAGRAVALISDAGTPLISDPGYKLVREAVAAGHLVVSLPGPSAPMAALASAGLPTDTFLFAGFLPPRSAARRARLAQLKDVPATLVLFEAPSRLAETLGDIAEALGQREAAVARELTKLYEEICRGTPDELARWAAQAKPKGEMVVLVGPPQPATASDAEIAAKLTLMLPEMRLSDAAKAVAEELGVAKGRVYEIGVALKRESAR